MTRAELKKQITDEYEAGEDFCSLDRRNHYAMMFDISDGDFWIDCFSGESWKVYHNADIVQVMPHIPYYGNELDFDSRVQRIFEWCCNHALPGVLEG